MDYEVDQKVSKRYNCETNYNVKERHKSFCHLFRTTWCPEEFRPNIYDIYDSYHSEKYKKPELNFFGHRSVVNISVN